MKATQLIAQLQALVAQHGDCDVILDDETAPIDYSLVRDVRRWKVDVDEEGCLVGFLIS